MNLFKQVIALGLLLTISLQSNAMFRNLASKLAARMPAASMMRTAKLAMPKLGQRTFATAKPAAKSLWTKPMIARAVALGGLGTSMAFVKDPCAEWFAGLASACDQVTKDVKNAVEEKSKAENFPAVPANAVETPKPQSDSELEKLLQDYQTCTEKVRNDLKPKPGYLYPQWYHPEQDKINLDNKLHACYTEHVKNLVKFLKANQVADGTKQTAKLVKLKSLDHTYLVSNVRGILFDNYCSNSPKAERIENYSKRITNAFVKISPESFDKSSYQQMNAHIKSQLEFYDEVGLSEQTMREKVATHMMSKYFEREQ